jgi:hypothetical protein
MKISVLDRIDTCPNSIRDIELYFEKLAQELEATQLLIGHVIVDGQPVYEEFVEYLKENIDGINEVEIVLYNLQQYISETLASAAQYTEKAVNELGNMAKEFYQIPSRETWNNFSDLLEGMQWIIETFVIIEKNGWAGEVLDYQAWNEYARLVLHIQEHVKDLNQALQSADTTLIGDILSYDIKPDLQNMQEALEKLLTSKVDN